jgi:hypothetical protein
MARGDRSAMICPRQRREVIAQRRSVPANGEKYFRSAKPTNFDFKYFQLNNCRFHFYI